MFGRHADADNRVRVKICGITNAADARAAIECGADALGFNFYRGSKRYLELGANKEWIADLPREVAKVAVLVNPSQEEAMEVARLPFFDALQLHGDESPAFCRQLAEQKVRFVKVLPAGAADGLDQIAEYFTDMILLDSGSDSFGGSGKTFPWQIAKRVVETNRHLKIILAGGLSPENVAAAIAQVRPFAVDVTTGVEAVPGRKDVPRLRAFFAAIRGS